jgi:hypothetical protein
MAWRRRCSIVLATLVVTASCDARTGSSREAHDDGGAGGADVGADAGAHPGHAPAKPGASAGAAAAITCGSATCRATAMFAACCVDATHGKCGVENETVGVACGVPAVADPGCPPVRIVFGGTSISAQGCCTARGLCGGFNLGSPCALVPVSDENDAGRAAAPRTCRPSD